MRTIVKGNENILKFWNGVAHQEVSYRLIRYHIRDDCSEGSLLLNTVTGELVILSAEEQEILNDLPHSYQPAMDDLIAHRFLVPESFEDLRSVNQLRNVMKKLRASEVITGFTIIPTSNCNARCFYCYESNEPHYSMTPETADKVADYIVDHCGGKKVSLNWFGGEPTLGEKRIDQICNRLKEKGIEFFSFMISNGYLFTREMARKAKEQWCLCSIQITLDGTETIYNQTKSYVNVQDNPFRRVLDNIAFLLDEKIRVSVRMNLDFHNADDLKELIQQLADRFADRKNFTAYVHELFEDQGFSPVSHSLAERLRLEEIKDALNGLIEQKGCISAGSFRNESGLPALKVFYCMSDTPTSLQINPLGQFGKCEHFLFGELIGDLDQGFDFNSSQTLYWLQPTYEESCKDCRLYPYCGKIETCITRNPCFSDSIRDIKMQSVINKMRQRVKESNENESA